MAELERDQIQQRVTSELGRARKRKVKRESGGPTQVEANLSNRRVGRRVLIKNGPSNREKLVAAKVKMTEVSVPLIQEKLNSTLDSISQLTTSKKPSRKQTLTNGSDSHSQHRKSELKRNDSLYKATSHTETQRIGNSKGGTFPHKNRRVFDAHSDAAPPVMVRGGMGGMAFGRVASSRIGKQKQPKRRIDVPLSVTGAELRLPSIPFVHLGWRVVSLAMVLMMVACLFLIWKAPVFQVNTVEAKGLQRLTVSDLNTVMRMIGKSVFTINPTVLDENLHQAFPELSTISINVGLPASVKVVVTEREPVIAWILDGSETWVDVEGISFPPRGNPTNALVRVEGRGTPPGDASAISPETGQNIPQGDIATSSFNTPSLKLTPELVSSILALGAKMPADTLLVYDSAHGLGWNDPQGWEVFFGEEDQDMEMKLSVYQALVQKLQNEGIQPALISVEYVHAPYYRTER